MLNKIVLPIETMDNMREAANVVRSAITSCPADHCGDMVTINQWNANALNEILRAKHAYYVTDKVDHKGIVCGVASMTGCGMLTALYVHPSFKDFGYGGTLLTFMERIAKDMEAPRVNLVCTATARPFYMKRGYKELGSAPQRGAGCTWNFPLFKELDYALI